MKSVFFLTSFLLLITSSVFADGVFKWKDARGNIQYGDEPPKNSNALVFDMPAITVIKNYGEQWKPLQTEPVPVRKQTAVVMKPMANAPAIAYQPTYSSLRFIAPRINQVILAKDGDVSAMISLRPPLKKGHKLVFVLDGKSAQSGKSRITNFKNLPDGSHSVSANVIDGRGTIVMKGTVVPFQIKR